MTAPKHRAEGEAVALGGDWYLPRHRANFNTSVTLYHDWRAMYDQARHNAEMDALRSKLRGWA